LTNFFLPNPPPRDVIPVLSRPLDTIRRLPLRTPFHLCFVGSFCYSLPLVGFTLCKLSSDSVLRGLNVSLPRIPAFWLWSLSFRTASPANSSRSCASFFFSHFSPTCWPACCRYLFFLLLPLFFLLWAMIPYLIPFVPPTFILPFFLATNKTPCQPPKLSRRFVNPLLFPVVLTFNHPFERSFFFLIVPS